MKFATAKEHRDFFQKHGWIEFEGLVLSEQLTQANQAIDQILAERLKTSPRQLSTLSSEDIYLQGRDLWRSNPFLQKWASQLRFAEIITELFDKRTLRLGYDQLFPTSHLPPSSQKNLSPYAKFLEKTASLQTVSCFTHVACGLLLTLNGREESGQEENVPETANIFSNHPGNVVFFQPQLLVQWSDLYAHVGQRFYLIVYTHASSHYQLEPQDPHTHDLKRLGYVFNEKLKDNLHPIVYHR